MNKDVLKWCRFYLPCQRPKIYKNTHLSPEKIEQPNGRFEHVHLDIVVKPIQQNYRYCLTMIDRFTRCPELVPLSNVMTKTIATAFWTRWIYFPFKSSFMWNKGTPWPDSFLSIMQKVRPTLTAHHTKQRMFLLKGIDLCTHVFLGADAVKQPLETPYTVPYEIVRREIDRVFTIKINGREIAISVDRLNPVGFRRRYP